LLAVNNEVLSKTETAHLSNYYIMKKLPEQVNIDLMGKHGFEAVHWFFKTDAVQYGVALKDGGVWNLTYSHARNRLKGTQGFPQITVSPTPGLKAKLNEAREWVIENSQK
jgi:hypothetical protein